VSAEASTRLSVRMRRPGVEGTLPGLEPPARAMARQQPRPRLRLRMGEGRPAIQEVLPVLRDAAERRSPGDEQVPRRGAGDAGLPGRPRRAASRRPNAVQGPKPARETSAQLAKPLPVLRRREVRRRSVTRQRSGTADHPNHEQIRNVRGGIAKLRGYTGPIFRQSLRPGTAPVSVGKVCTTKGEKPVQIR